MLRSPLLNFPSSPSPTWLLSLVVTSALLGASGCATRPEAPRTEHLTATESASISMRLNPLLPTEVLLLGEQHDAPQHQVLERQAVTELASRGLLAALALEMADAGMSTAGLKPGASAEQVRTALVWTEEAWPWEAYGPAIMTAVHAGVPVLGANLPRSDMKSSMANSRLDQQLPGPALKAQQQLIRLGHCNLLPESQITPMARIQIAKDMRMAATLQKALLPGKVVVLLTGSVHADRRLGVAQHLPGTVKVKAVRMRAGDGADADRAEVFDAVWPTPALPETDYCAGLAEQFKPAGTPK